MVAKSYTSITTGFQELREIHKEYRTDGISYACVSGGFDPLHNGHVELIRLASALADELIVLINDDKWLMRKKGWVFYPEDVRLEIVQSIKGVSKAFILNDFIDDVHGALEVLRPSFFVNGGDRHPGNTSTAEDEVCKQYNIQTLYFGNKLNSSSDLCHQFYKNYLKVRFRDC